MLFPHRCSWACEQPCPGRPLGSGIARKAAHKISRWEVKGMSQRQGHCSLGSQARCHRAPSPGCWQQGKCVAGSCPCKCTAVSIWFLGEMCPAHPSHCHGEGAKQTAGRVGSSAACHAGCHGANKERGYLQPAGNCHPRPGTASAHCIAIRPAAVRHMGSYRGGGWRQLCSRSRSSRGICSFQQQW